MTVVTVQAGLIVAIMVGNSKDRFSLVSAHLMKLFIDRLLIPEIWLGKNSAMYVKSISEKDHKSISDNTREKIFR